MQVNAGWVHTPSHRNTEASSKTTISKVLRTCFDLVCWLTRGCTKALLLRFFNPWRQFTLRHLKKDGNSCLKNIISKIPEKVVLNFHSKAEFWGRWCALRAKRSIYLQGTVFSLSEKIVIKILSDQLFRKATSKPLNTGNP